MIILAYSYTGRFAAAFHVTRTVHFSHSSVLTQTLSRLIFSIFTVLLALLVAVFVVVSCFFLYYHLFSFLYMFIC